MLVFEACAFENSLRFVGHRTEIASARVPAALPHRLMNLGVKVTRTNSTVDELWGATFLARLAFLRPGKHHCISWRGIDHLAMGTPSV